jgi:hypothetical protein
MYADTIDVWHIKINNRVVFRSNQMLICYHHEPMKLNLNDYNENDTVKIFYWTDSGLEKMKWNLMLKDTSLNNVKTFTNKLDSAKHFCYPDPCNTYYTFRRNYISIRVIQLRQIMANFRTDKLLVYFKHLAEFYAMYDTDPYDGKPVCIINQF